MHVLNGKTFICNKNGLFTFTIKRTNHDKEITPSYPQQVSPPSLANPRLHRPQARSRTRRPSLRLRNTIKTKFYTSNPQPIGFSGILLAKRQNSFYCTYFLHNRNVADTKSPYPIKRLEVIRWFNQKSMVFNQSLS